MGELDVLFQPIRLGPIEIKNRIMMAPLNETMASAEGEVTIQQAAYYAARAKGGVGLVVTGAILGTRLASRYVWQRNLRCFHLGHLQGLNLLTEWVHYFGAKIAAQMSIGFGVQGHSYDPEDLPPAPSAGYRYIDAAEAMAPSLRKFRERSERARLFCYGHITREMTIEEIQREQEEFARSCQLAVCAGFDVIEIHAPHGYLEHNFLSPLTNKRTDIYGGSWTNRKRFLLEVAEKVRYAVGPDVAVGCRISAEEHFEGGLTVEEMIDVAKDLEKIGIDYISLSDGAGYIEEINYTPTEEWVDHWIETAQKFKRELKIPVVVASVHDPYKAASVIANGKADIIALGRQLLCDPEWANKVKEGRIKDIRRCRRCNLCVMRCLSGIPPACPQNPNLGREWALEEYRLGPRTKEEGPILPKRIEKMPALVRPFGAKEIPLPEKAMFPFRPPVPIRDKGVPEEEQE